MKTCSFIIFIILTFSSCTNENHKSPQKTIAMETIIQARDEGINYQEAFNRALKKDLEQIYILLWFSLKADTAGSIGHGIAIIDLMEGLGDDYFSSILSDQSIKVKKAVYHSIDIGADYAQNTEKTLSKLKNRFQKTFMVFENLKQ